MTDLAARALRPRAQLPFLGSCPHHPHSVSILLPTFLSIKCLLDASKYCRQACFVWFVLFCWRGTHCSREIYCTHKPVLPTNSQALPCRFKFAPCFSRNPAAHLAPSARENGAQAPGPGGGAGQPSKSLSKGPWKGWWGHFWCECSDSILFNCSKSQTWQRAPTVIGGKF